MNYMKVRKTTKLLIGFIIAFLLSGYIVFRIADYKGIKAVERAEKAGRSLTKPNESVSTIKNRITNERVKTIKMDTIIISPDGDTVYSSSTSVDVDW